MYRYEDCRPFVFTEDGQVMFLRIRDRAALLCREAGACRFLELTRPLTGDSWHMIACVDRLVELGELREVVQAGTHVGQHRVFVAVDS